MTRSSLVALGPAPETIDVVGAFTYVRAQPIGPPGVPFTTRWQPASGANDVEVDDAGLTILPAAAERDLGTVPATKVTNGWELRLPGRSLVRRLGLHGLGAVLDGVPFQISGPGSMPAGVRVAVVVDGQLPPRFTVPAVRGRGLLPAVFTGAGLAGGSPPTLSLPDTPATRLRLTVVTGDVEDGFSELDTSLASATAVIAVPVTDAVVLGPDGGVAWSDPGPLVQAVDVDLRVPLRSALRTALDQSPVAATFAVQAAAGSAARVSPRGPRGALVRRFRRVLTTRVPASPTVLDLGVGPPLSAEQPSSVTADVRIVYDGLRRSAELSDDDASDATDGVVVGATPVLRPFPIAGAGPLPVGRIGLTGRSAEETDLVVSIVTTAPAGGEVVGRPCTTTLPASPQLGRVWVDLPPVDPTDWAGAHRSPLALSVRAGRGRFLWAVAASGRPDVVVLVRDPAPPPADVRLGTTTIGTVGASATTLHAASLPPSAFAAASTTLSCTLAVTVELAELTLRYAR